MAVIIRLQNLPWEASAADIREFFVGLSIPEGGVHIVGGDDGDAFIGFGTDEDARRAMRTDGRRIKGTKVKLLLSSRLEMEQVIAKARGDLETTTTVSTGSQQPRQSPSPTTTISTPNIHQQPPSYNNKPQQQSGYPSSFRDERNNQQDSSRGDQQQPFGQERYQNLPLQQKSSFAQKLGVDNNVTSHPQSERPGQYSQQPPPSAGDRRLPEKDTTARFGSGCVRADRVGGSFPYPPPYPPQHQRMTNTQQPPPLYRQQQDNVSHPPIQPPNFPPPPGDAIKIENLQNRSSYGGLVAPSQPVDAPMRSGQEQYKDNTRFGGHHVPFQPPSLAANAGSSLKRDGEAGDLSFRRLTPPMGVYQQQPRQTSPTAVAPTFPPSTDGPSRPRYNNWQRPAQQTEMRTDNDGRTRGRSPPSSRFDRTQLNRDYDRRDVSGERDAPMERRPSPLFPYLDPEATGDRNDGSHGDGQRRSAGGGDRSKWSSNASSSPWAGGIPPWQQSSTSIGADIGGPPTVHSSIQQQYHQPPPPPPQPPQQRQPKRAGLLPVPPAESPMDPMISVPTLAPPPLISPASILSGVLPSMPLGQSPRDHQGDSALSFTSPSMSDCQSAGFFGGLSSSSLPMSLPNFSANMPLQVANMPMQVEEQLVCAYFSNLPPELCHPSDLRLFFPPSIVVTEPIKTYVDDHAENCAYVRFDNPVDCHRVLVRDGENGVRVRACSIGEYERASSSQQRHPPHVVGTNEVAPMRFCLELGNIPYRASRRDIDDFFIHGDVHPLQIQKALNADGAPSDRWFIECRSIPEAERALSLAGRALNVDDRHERPVRIRRSNPLDMERALAVVPSDNRYGMRDSRSSERLSAGSSRRVKEDSDQRRDRDRDTRVNKDRDHRPRRRTRSRSRSPRSRDKDYNRKDRDSRKLDDRSKRRAEGSNSRGSGRSGSGEETASSLNKQTSSSDDCCVQVTGLPFTINQRDVCAFFDGVATIAPPDAGSVKLMKEPRGSAFVRFASASEAERALGRDSAFLGSERVRLRRCSIAEMNTAVQQQFAFFTSSTPTPLHSTVAITQQPSPAPSENLLKSPQRHVPEQRADTIGYPVSVSAASAASPSTLPIAVVQPNVSTADRSSFGKTLLSACTPPPGIEPIDGQVALSIGPPGTVIALHGLPSDVTFKDLARFFAGFQLEEESVRMHFDDGGRATGDCLLAMCNRDDAVDAVIRLRGCPLRDRPVTAMYVVLPPPSSINVTPSS